MEQKGYYSNLIQNQRGIGHNSPEFNTDLSDDEINKIKSNIQEISMNEGEDSLVTSDSMKLLSKVPSNNELEEQIKLKQQKKEELEKSASEVTKKLIPLLMQMKRYVFMGIFFSLSAGLVWPLYGMLLAKALNALSWSDPDKIKSEGLKVALYFLILALIAGISIFFQKYYLF